MTSVCIVSNEVYPLDKGGIGRLMYNFAVHNRQSAAPVDLHFLLPNNLLSKSATIKAEFRSLATIHYCSQSLEGLGSLGTILESCGGYESLDLPMIESLRYYGGLISARDHHGLDFDFVEFPDYGGWGVASIAAKLAGLNFSKTQFAIRLHSTFSLIVDHEPFAHEPSEWLAALSDLERFALENADLIVAHLHSTAALNAEHFGFSPEWLEKVRVQLPPIVLTSPERQAMQTNYQDGSNKNSRKDFMFSSRLQPFKRPDIFVRAAVRFMDQHPSADTRFFIVSYGWDKDYVDWLKHLVPTAWSQNILFLEGLDERGRADLLLTCILVIPSDFESLCLLAHEARQMGVRLILNGRCLAFGAEPALWRDEEDCLFFDGDFVSLARAMDRALSWSPSPPKPAPPITCYWERSGQPLPVRAAEENAPLSLGFLLYGTPDLEELATQVQNLRSLSGGTRISVVVPRETFEAAGVSDSAWKALGVDVHVSSWIVPTATEIVEVLSALDVDAIAFVPTHIKVDRAFWHLGARCLAREPEVDVFTSHLKTPNAQRPIVLYHGSGPSTALFTDRVAHRASIFRASCLTRLGLRELADSRWHQDLCIRAVRAGDRVVVAPVAMATDMSSLSYSRVPASRFFATQNAEASRAARRVPHRINSIRSADSVEFVEHNDWLARQELLRTNLLGATRGRSDDFLRIDDVVLKSRTADEASGYNELEIVLRGLGIGRWSVAFLGFKLSEFQGKSQLEFRDAGNSKQIFGSWPPATADEWGPVAVWAPGPGRHPYAQFFEQAPADDIRRLRLLVSSLPEVIALLPLQAKERFHWTNVATSLAPEEVQEDGGEIDELERNDHELPSLSIS